MQIAKERMFLDADRKKLLPEGHQDAAFLYAAPGDQIPASAAEQFGIVDGELKKGGAKSQPAPPNKESGPGENKDGKPGEAKPKELTDIKGIGAKTAKLLAGAGVTSVALLADVDPEKVPTVDGLPPNFDWAKVVAEAKALAPAQPAPAAAG